MSTTAIIDGLKKASISELELIKQLREGANAIFDGMEAEYYKRAGALGELGDDLRELEDCTQGLLAKIQALEQEKTALKDEVEALRLAAATAARTAQQNVCHLTY